jgi:hypothetical protein
VDLPGLRVTAEAAETGVKNGWGEENASAVVKAVADRAGVNLNE